MKSVVYGLIAGVLGALAWALIAFATEYEIGWIAWGVGGLVGFAVAAGNEKGERSAAASGAIAVVIAALSIMAGKYVAVHMFMPADAELVAMFSESLQDEEFVVSFIADEVAAEFESAGQELAWPQGVDPTFASTEPEYPDDVWAEAKSRWAQLDVAERIAFRDEVAQMFADTNLPALRAALATEAFMLAFAPMDLLFFGLAMFTAFKVGAGRTAAAGDGEPDLAEPVFEAAQAPDLAGPVLEVEQAPAREPVAEADLDRDPCAASYCPTCGGQFRAGISVCGECGVTLLPFSTPAS